MNRTTLLATAALTIGLAASPAQSTTLRWAAQNDILTLDPHSQNHATTNAILMHSYEGLTRYSAKYEIEPSLATKWTYISPTQVRFDLRKGVKFHDGTPFTADDVVFSYGRIKQPQGTMSIYVTGVAEIKKVDEHTVDFMLSSANPILLRNIVDFRIMSRGWAEKNKAMNVQDYKAKEDTYASRNVNGTGSYKITGWAPDQRVTMTINRDWWDKTSGNVTEVIYTPVKSDPTRVAALLSGDVDMLTDLPTPDVARLRGEGKLPEAIAAQLMGESAEATANYFKLKVAQGKILAPIAGQILKGDFRDKQGTTIKLGEEIFQVGDVNSERLEVEMLVHERDIQEVQLAQKNDKNRQTGKLATTSSPEEKVPFEIYRLVPLSEQKENKNVFRAYGTVAGAGNNNWLPGQAGEVKIDIEPRPLAWQWTHRFVDWVKMKAWTWL